MIGWLTAFGLQEMALALTVMFVCYLRPSELFMIRVCDLINHRGIWTIILAPSDTNTRTKTGQQDEGVLLTNRIFPRLGEALEHFLSERGLSNTTGRRTSLDGLWTFSMVLFRQTIMKAARALCLPEGFCLYMARHGGVTCDILQEFREWLEAKTRGRWHSDTTLRRYCKQGTVVKYLNMCPKVVVEFGAAVMSTEDDLFSLFMGKKLMTPPDVTTWCRSEANPADEPSQRSSKKTEPFQGRKRAHVPLPICEQESEDEADGVQEVPESLPKARRGRGQMLSSPGSLGTTSIAKSKAKAKPVAKPAAAIKGNMKQGLQPSVLKRPAAFAARRLMKKQGPSTAGSRP